MSSLVSLKQRSTPPTSSEAMEEPDILLFPFDSQLDFNALNFNYPLKSSCTYVTKLILLIRNHNHRHFLQQPSRIQHRVSVSILDENPNFFIREVKPCTKQLDRYYVTVGVSGIVPPRKRPPSVSQSVLQHSSESHNSSSSSLERLNTCQEILSDPNLTVHVEGQLSFLLDDSKEVLLSLQATFVEAIAYERHFSKQVAEARAFNTSDDSLKLWKAIPAINLGCSFVPESPYIVENPDVHPEWGLQVLFPYTSHISSE